MQNETVSEKKYGGIRCHKLAWKAPDYFYYLANAETTRDLQKISRELKSGAISLQLDPRPVTDILETGIRFGDSVFIELDAVNEKNINLVENLARIGQEEITLNLIPFSRSEGGRESFLNFARMHQAEAIPEIQVEEISELNPSIVMDWLRHREKRLADQNFKLFDRVGFSIIYFISGLFYTVVFPVMALVLLYQYLISGKEVYGATFTHVTLASSAGILFALFTGINPLGGFYLFTLITAIFVLLPSASPAAIGISLSLSLIYYILFQHMRTYFDTKDFSQLIFEQFEDYNKKKNEKAGISSPGFIGERFKKRGVYRPINPTLWTSAFISHRNDESGIEITQFVKEVLEQHGIRTHVDFLDLQGGFSYRDQLASKLHTAGIVVCILTDMNNEQEREWVQRELKASALKYLHSGSPALFVIEVNSSLDDLVTNDRFTRPEENPVRKALADIEVISVTKEDYKQVLERDLVHAILNKLNSSYQNLNRGNKLVFSDTMIALTPVSFLFMIFAMFIESESDLFHTLLFVSTLSLTNVFCGYSLIRVIHWLFGGKISFRDYLVDQDEIQSVRIAISIVVGIVLLLDFLLSSHTELIICAFLVAVALNLMEGELKDHLSPIEIINKQKQSQVH